MKKIIIFIVIVGILFSLGFIFLNKSHVLDNKSQDMDSIHIENETVGGVEPTDNVVDDKKENYSFDDQNGGEVTISADKIVSATGFSGASNHKFYLENGNLFYENISISGSKEQIAKNVKDLFLDGENVTAIKGNDFSIVKDNNYITYK